jgi:DNA topoisomerase-2
VNDKGWKIKYYKGLGTSDDKEAKEYFQNIGIHEIKFRYNDRQDDEAVDLAFNKKKADDRKEWLANFDPNVFVDHNQKVLRYYDFIHKELIQFSVANNQRAIPSLCDGLKSGQRKILYSCFKRNLTKEIKVAQLAGYVAEHSEYHHGEQNLADTIVGMAQTFVGSNNINLLMPNGQFGSRAMGGKDAASARYLHTVLNKVTRFIFPEADDHILNYVEEDGKLVEPTFYTPIIPMVLVNGAEGIGTGWATNIPNYCPRQIAHNILNKLDGKEMNRMDPYFKGYTGELTPGDKGYSVKGSYNFHEESNSLEITELPIKKWTRDYKNYLEEMMQDKDQKLVAIDDMREYHTSRKVHFLINFDSSQRELSEAEIEKIFKLTGNISTANMVLFDESLKIRKYATEIEILEEFVGIRMRYYHLRKDYLISRIERDIAMMENKYRFISEVNDDIVIISKKAKKQIVKQLIDRKYTPHSKLPRIKSSIEDNIIAKLQKDEEEAGQGEGEEGGEGQERQGAGGMSAEEGLVEKNAKEYNYLLSMPIWAMSLEQLEKLKKEIDGKMNDLKNLQRKPVEDIWREDIKKFLEVLDKVENEEAKEIEKEDKKAKKAPGSGEQKPKKKKKVDKSPSSKMDELDMKKSGKTALDEESLSSKPSKKIVGKKDKGKEDAKPSPRNSGNIEKKKLEPEKSKPPVKNNNTGSSNANSQPAPVQKAFSLDLETQFKQKLEKSMLKTFANNPIATERIKKVMQLSTKELEAKDASLLTLEEKIWLKELKAGEQPLGHSASTIPAPHSLSSTSLTNNTIKNITRISSVLDIDNDSGEDGDDEDTVRDIMRANRVKANKKFADDEDDD